MLWREAVKSEFGKHAAVLLMCCLLVTGVYPQMNPAAPPASKPVHPSKNTSMSAPTPAPAAKVYQTLEEFRTQFELRSAGKNPPEKVVRLTESEVNAYLKEEVRIKADKYPALKSLAVVFISPDYLGIKSTIDFQKVKGLDSNLALRSMQSMLSGVKEIYVEGTLTSADRLFQFKLEKAYLGGLRLPVTLIEYLVKHFAAPQDPSFELSKPALLPFGLQKADIQAGNITLRG
jgi:hypothetical protein